MPKLKENTIINNEDNIDLESNDYNTDYTFKVPEQKNMNPRMNAELVYAMLKIYKKTILKNLIV